MAGKHKAPVELPDLVRAVRERTTGTSALDRVAVAVRYSEALKSLGDDLVGHFVDEARRSGCSWAQIGSHLGVSKQAAQQRHTLRQLFRARRSRTHRKTLPPLGREAEEVLAHADAQARRLKHNYLGTEHLLLGLLKKRPGRGGRILRDMGLVPQAVLSKVRRVIGEGIDAPAGPIPFTPRAKKVLELSARTAEASGQTQVLEHHLLMGLIDEGEGLAARILADNHVTRRRVEEALAK